MKLQEDLVLLRKAGFGVTGISYDSEAVLKEFAARKHITYPLLADHDSKVIREYDVVDRRYRRGNQLDIETETVHSNAIGYIPVFGLAYPSVFVISPDRTILWRFVSESAEFRYSAAAILEGSIDYEADATNQTVPAKRIAVSATNSDSTAALGTRMVLGLELKLPEGVHVYAPGAGKEYHGITWEMGDSRNCWQAADTEYPKPALRTFAFDDTTVPVYEGDIRFSREVIIRPAITPKQPEVYNAFRAVCLDDKQRIHIRATLIVQACSEKECYPPEKLPLEWTVRFEPPDQSRSPVDLRREFEP